jgi:hypothetical protein
MATRNQKLQAAQIVDDRYLGKPPADKHELVKRIDEFEEQVRQIVREDKKKHRRARKAQKIARRRSRNRVKS